MDLLSRNDVKRLMEYQDGTCVSIYMPAVLAGSETQQNPIRLRNLLREAEEQLTSRGWRPPDAQELLKPAHDLVGNRPFWQHQSQGLALFLAPGYFEQYRLPVNFEELVMVNQRFHIKPLLPLLSGDGQFYILSLSQKHIRLLRGSRYSVDEIQLEDVPESLAEALRFDDPEKQLQFHSGSPAPDARGGQQTIFHGHGTGGDEAEDKENILRFFQKLDKGIHDYLHDSRAPLVLAGVEYLHPIYREANSYPNLIDEGITGNFDDLPAQSLHDRAWAVVEPHFKEAQQQAAGLYRQLANSPRGSGDLEEIVPAACYGRVQQLFVAVDAKRWGKFNPDNSEVVLHDEIVAGDEDLLDLAAMHTLLNSGQVYAVPSAEIPGNSVLAAVFRY